MKPCISLQVVTFDAGGVSGHSNHVALYAAVRYDSLGDEGGRGLFICLGWMVSNVLSHSLSEPYEAYYYQRASVGHVAHYISPHPPCEKSLSSLNYGFFLLNSWEFVTPWIQQRGS